MAAGAVSVAITALAVALAAQAPAPAPDAAGPAASVRQAIVAALRARGCAAAAARAAALPPGALSAPAGGSARGATFWVTAIRPDPLQHRTLFRIARARASASRSPAASAGVQRPAKPLLPFWVSLPGAVPARADQAARPQQRAAWRPPADGPLLVRPHRPALLTMLAAGMRIALVVIPLQQGRRGQLVEAEDPANHRFLTAKVTGKNELEGRL